MISGIYRYVIDDYGGDKDDDELDDGGDEMDDGGAMNPGAVHLRG